MCDIADGYNDITRHEKRRANKEFGELHSILSEYDGPVAIDPGLACGALWDSELGPPPEHVAALAFWLPGEPLPTEATP